MAPTPANAPISQCSTDKTTLRLGREERIENNLGLVRLCLPPRHLPPRLHETTGNVGSCTHPSVERPWCILSSTRERKRSLDISRHRGGWRDNNDHDRDEDARKRVAEYPPCRYGPCLYTCLIKRVLFIRLLNRLRW